MKQQAPHWIPAAFCAFLSIMALVGWVSTLNSQYPNWALPAFYSFLPMCFFFVGSAATRQHQELQELRQKVADLEQKGSQSHG